MYSVKTLGIAGYHNELVPHTFLWHDYQTQHIGIVLPGFGYTCEMPLLYYSTRLLLSLGADVLQVEYAYHEMEGFQALSYSEQMQWLFTDVASAWCAALSQRTYQQVTIIGRSMGTLAVGHLFATGGVPLQTRVVWLTPLLRDEKLRSQMKQYQMHSLFVIGTADPHYEPSYLVDIQAMTNGKAITIEGANHSLEMGAISCAC